MASGVNQNGATSKQELALDALLELVGDLEVGAAIPPERRLAASSACRARRCARRSTSWCARACCVRRHGSGTYVAEPKIALPLTMTSFSEDMRRRGMRPGSRVLSFEDQRAARSSAQRLRCRRPTQVWAIRRLRLADDETMAIEVLHVPKRVAPGLTRRDLEGQSFYELLARALRHRRRGRASRPSSRRDQRGGGRDPRRARCTRPPSCSSGPARASEGRWWSSSGRSTAVTATGS